MAVWFDDSGPSWSRPYVDDIVDAWVDLAAPYGAGRAAHTKGVIPITDAVGWFQYLSKHAVRGLHHYQRNPANIPQEWQGKTGRMWGKVGDWPLASVIKLQLSGSAWEVFRRVVRGWRIAQARSRQDWKALRSARRMLQAPTREKSYTRGLSEWMPIDHTLKVTDWLLRCGYRIEGQ